MMMKTEEYHDIYPDMGVLFSRVISNLGHDVVAALQDLLDNSFDAEATSARVHILKNKSTKEISGYCIIDNGKGMSLNELVESFRFATDSIHKAGDAGKFGVGGTIASSTLANRKVTLTRAKGTEELLAAEVDINWFSQPGFDPEQACRVRGATREERALFNKFVGKKKHGTCIILSDPKELEYRHSHHLARKLEREFSISYHKFLASGKEIVISHGDKVVNVSPKDPLYFDQPEKLLKSYSSEKISFKGQEIGIRFSILNLDLIKNTGKSYDDQGIYVVRNGRLIVRGASLGLWPNHPTRNAGRIEISFSEDLDDDFKLTATKNRVILSKDLKDKLEPVIKRFRTFVQKLAEKAPPGKDISEQLKKEDQAFSDMLSAHGATLELPFSRTAGAGKVARSKIANKTGSVKPKGTNIKRNGKKYVSPEFEYVVADRVKQHIWFEFDEALKMKVVINTSHPFVRDLYVKGSQETKRALRAEWAAACMVQYNFHDSPEESTVESYSTQVSNSLTAVYDSIT